VDAAPGATVALHVYDNDDVEQLARDFATTHALSESSRQQVTYTTLLRP
jgi:hypothetical protein